MKEIILIKDGELALKGLNRSSFESMLMKNIKITILYNSPNFEMQIVAVLPAVAMF